MGSALCMLASTALGNSLAPNDLEITKQSGFLSTKENADVHATDPVPTKQSGFLQMDRIRRFPCVGKCFDAVQGTKKQDATTTPAPETHNATHRPPTPWHSEPTDDATPATPSL